jgi:hypothetical protein
VRQIRLFENIFPLMKPGAAILVLVTLAAFSACSDETAKLQEQVSILRSKLEDVELEASKRRLIEAEQRDRRSASSSPETATLRQQLAEAQRRIAELEQAARAPSLSAPRQIPDSTLRSTYDAAKEALEREIAKNPGYSVESWTTHKIEIPQEVQWPFRSKISVSLRGAAGNVFTLSAPVMADASGAWKFPTFQELLRSETQPAATVYSPPPTAPTVSRPAPAPTPVPTPPPAGPRVTERIGSKGERIPVIDIGLPPAGR